MADIEEIMERLYNGGILRIDDQEAAYISMTGDSRQRFVMRRIIDSKEREAKARGETPKYEESRHQSLAEALLTLMDYSWLKEKS